MSPCRSALRRCWHTRGCANPAGEDALAERVYLESFAAYTELGDKHGAANLLVRLGSSALYRDDLAAARDFGERSLALSRRDRRSRSRGARLSGSSAKPSSGWGTRSARWSSSGRAPTWRARSGSCGSGPACCAGSRTGRSSTATRRRPERDLEEALRLSQELGDRISVVFALARFARIEAEAGELERGRRALGCGRGRGGDGLASARGTASASASPARCSPIRGRRLRPRPGRGTPPLARRRRGCSRSAP